MDVEKKYLIPPRAMIRACRNTGKNLKLADSTGKELSGIDTLLQTLVIRRLLHRVLGAEEKNVGLLFPTSVYGALVNAALAMDSRVSVNLNYTFGIETINYCIRKAEIKHVLTTKRLVDRLKERFPDMKFDAELLVLENMVGQITFFDKLSGWFDAKFTPTALLEKKLGLDKISQDDLLAIIFTSGSTGTPKGVMISHKNLASNVEGFNDHLQLNDRDSVLGVLPLFHAYGFSTNMWITLMGKVGGIYHFNPLEPKKVGEMGRKYKPTIMASTATFQRNFLRRCPKEDFESVRTVICGAEKVPLDLIEAWEEKFGNPLCEGYGTTELSPVVSTNVDRYRRKDYKDWNRVGSVGRPFFNIQTRVVDLESGEILPPNSPGMLQIKAPNVMLGYYKEPEKTAEVIKDGWYTTGDVAKLDEDGFIWITGRVSRMSKIGGEMVPHILVEEMIEKIIRKCNKNAADSNEESENTGPMVAVVGLPDEKKGERIIVLHVPLSVSPEEICKQMHGEGIPNLWVPLAQNFREIERIPILGTGKMDLHGIKEIAEKLFG